MSQYKLLKNNAQIRENILKMHLINDSILKVALSSSCHKSLIDKDGGK